MVTPAIFSTDFFQESTEQNQKGCSQKYRSTSKNHGSRNSQTEYKHGVPLKLPLTRTSVVIAHKLKPIQQNLSFLITTKQVQEGKPAKLCITGYKGTFWTDASLDNFPFLNFLTITITLFLEGARFAVLNTIQ